VQLEDGGMSAGTYGGLLFLVCFVSLLLLAIALMPPKWRDALWGYLLQPCKATATMTDLRARVPVAQTEEEPSPVVVEESIPAVPSTFTPGEPKGEPAAPRLRTRPQEEGASHEVAEEGTPISPGRVTAPETTWAPGPPPPGPPTLLMSPRHRAAPAPMMIGQPATPGDLPEEAIHPEGADTEVIIKEETEGEEDQEGVDESESADADEQPGDEGGTRLFSSPPALSASMSRNYYVGGEVRIGVEEEADEGGQRP